MSRSERQPAGTASPAGPFLPGYCANEEEKNFFFARGSEAVSGFCSTPGGPAVGHRRCYLHHDYQPSWN